MYSSSNLLTVMMCGSDNDIDLTNFNDHYDYQFMWLAEDLFLCKSVARRAFPPFFYPTAPKIPYHRNLYHLMVWSIVIKYPNLAKCLLACF